jgi:hypothetical protein
MKHRLTRWHVLVGLTALLMAPLALSQEQRGGALVGRIQEELNQLKLTDEQKVRTQEILSKAREKFRDLATELIQAEPPVRRMKLNEFLTEVAEQIKPVLDERQRAEFSDRIELMRLRPGAGRPQPATNPMMGEGDRPRFGTGPAPGNRPGPMLERLREAADSLDLSPEQRGLIAQLFADAQAKFQEIRAQGQGDLPAMREKLAPIVQDVRRRVMDILTPPQREKFERLMMQNPPPRGAPEGGRPGGRRAMMDMQEQVDNNPTTAPIAEMPEVPAESAVGQPAPDFTLKKLDGQNIQLSTYQGKIVLLIFGSYTSPSFRQRVIQLERLKRDYGARIHPIIVYTAENHPVGKWEVQRNKDEGISLEQPTDMDGRIALARRARESLKITVPIVVDTMDDATMQAYGGTTNAAVLIGRDGMILARQKWFEPYALRGEIDAAVK